MNKLMLTVAVAGLCCVQLSAQSSLYDFIIAKYCTTTAIVTTK